jgi:hypothetical protein
MRRLGTEKSAAKQREIAQLGELFSYPIAELTPMPIERMSALIPWSFEPAGLQPR